VQVGDLIRHKQTTGNRKDPGAGIVTGVSRNGPPGIPVYVTAVWMGWFGERSIEQQYLEVISESR